VSQMGNFRPTLRVSAAIRYPLITSVGIVASFCMAQASEDFLQTRQGSCGVRVLFARLTRAPEAGHEPQIGLGLLPAELPQRLPAVSSPDVKQIGLKGFPETVTWRPSRATTVASDKTATYVAQDELLGR
jgi:hypothetical protein